jgi:hypothetical protein
MAYVPVHYVTGNWTVDEKVGLTPTSTYGNGTKSITVHNINWPTDFSFSGETSKGDGKVYKCTKNTGRGQNLVYTIKVSRISDIYQSITDGDDAPFKKTPIEKLTKRGGYQIQVRVDALLRASNSATGEEGDLPLSGWQVVRIPDHPAAVNTAYRYLASLIMGGQTLVDSTVLAGLVEDAMAGDLDPTH